ncbi:sulfite exporter TauE/SafE family protein [Prolixibacter bellariivorans]|uniref:sulfite exporter TauE/SafE family protein n=1 Tax=Prolixibacter bellariivorans TaxID=314319 RepID=UPI00046E6E6D|nr:sulfite exporter TauE/SafE family protein [Prolixibacter bellariivorans]
MEWVFIAIVILFASVLKGLTGFGFALLAMPFLLIFYPAKLVIPVLTLFNLLTSTQIILKIPNLKLNRYTLKIPIWGIIGTLPGVVLLNFVEDRPFKIFVGSMLIIVSFAFLKGFRFRIKDPLRGSVTAGLTSGFLGASPPSAVLPSPFFSPHSTFPMTISGENLPISILPLLHWP